MELVLSIIIIVQTYVGVRFYVKTQKELDNINKQIADIHRHDVERIYEHIEKVEGDLTQNILEIINELKRDNANEFKEINNNIEHKKVETEQGVREYLNSWRTSGEFRSILRDIEKSENKQTTQNTY